MFHIVLYVELVLRLKSDYVWYFYYALFVPNMPHLIIIYISISISHFHRGLIVHVVKMLVSYLRIITRLDPGGDWVKTLYTMLSIFLLLRVVLFKPR